MLRRLTILSVCTLSLIAVKAQYTMGVSGLLHVPSADMQADGTFMAGANYLPTPLTPANWNYNTGNYFLNLTFLPFAEVAYRCTLLRGLYAGHNKYQQDRSVSLRLRLWKENKYLPSIVAGSNDTFTTNQLNPFEEVSSNRFFASVFAVATKHIPINGHDLSLSCGAFIPMREGANQKGLFAGLSYRPAFLQPLSLMVEYDTNGINAGATALLFHHCSVYLFAYDLKNHTGGIRYEFTLITNKP